MDEGQKYALTSPTARSRKSCGQACANAQRAVGIGLSALIAVSTIGSMGQ
ncbi:MAG: hypothetical protein KME30_18800 [Iphinoe sp. HA4291-MV1]|jgi:hypothetical protein|nr:hypothetical protein [Iphinoe sp. HA4291-MV1]